MLASSTKPLRDKEDQETPRRKRIVEREKWKTEKTQNKKKIRKTKSKKKENFEIKFLEDNKMQLNKHEKVIIQLKTKVWIEEHTGFM
jgi:archaellin